MNKILRQSIHPLKMNARLIREIMRSEIEIEYWLDFGSGKQTLVETVELINYSCGCNEDLPFYIVIWNGKRKRPLWMGQIIKIRIHGEEIVSD